MDSMPAPSDGIYIQPGGHGVTGGFCHPWEHKQADSKSPEGVITVTSASATSVALVRRSVPPPGAGWSEQLVYKLVVLYSRPPPLP